MKIKTGDTVVVISGKDKGKVGTIQKVFPKTNRVIVDGVNLRKKHTKPNQKNNEGTIKEIYAPIDASNVMIQDPKTKKPTRIGHTEVNGKKVRVTKASGSKLN